MTITINKTDGTVLATVNDGVVDTSATNLALIGRLYRNYGELVNENFVKLLENFANASSPTAPIRGQLWFDTVNRTLKVFRTTGFVSLGSLTASNAQPNNPSIGDLWFDTIDQQLKIYNNTWIVVGPSYTSSQGKTGIFTETVRDTTNGNRLIISSYINNSIASIHSYSSDTWIPQTAISGFTNIQPGINLSNLNNQRFVGTASNANTIGGISSTSLLRNDQNGTINGNLTLLSNSGLTIGSINSKIYTDSTDLFLSNSVGDTQFWNLNEKIVEISASNKQLLASDGNVSKPSFSFIENPNSGLFHSGNGNISVVNNGSVIADFSPGAIGLNSNVILSGSISTTGAVIAGNVALGNTISNTITFNTNKLSAPNGLIITSLNVNFTNNIGISGSATVSNNLNIGGNINLTGDANLSQYSIVSSLNTAKYWINFDGRTSNLAIQDSYDIDSLTKTGTNTYTLGLAKPLTSNAICGVGSNGGRISVVPVIGATSITIVTLSETENMGFVIYSA